MTAKRAASSDDGTGAGKAAQGGGELSGLLRHAEALQRELDKALTDLKSESVEGRDAARMATVRLAGDGSVQEIRLQSAHLDDAERRALEAALAVAIRAAVERLFELRRQRATAVTKGLALPGLFT